MKNNAISIVCMTIYIFTLSYYQHQRIENFDYSKISVNIE